MLGILKFFAMKKLYTFLFFAIFGLNNINAATFSSVSSGTWSSPATWTLTSGTDSDTIPDSGDDVTINAGHTINLVVVSNFVKLFTNNGILKGNSKRFNVYGNFTNNGSVSGLILYIQAPCVFTSASSFNGAITWFINSNLTISAGTSIVVNNTMLVNYGKSVLNLGNATLGGGITLQGSWTNGVNSSLAVSNNITSTGPLNCSATSNTVTYSSSNCKQIKNATYYDLKINAATSVTRTAQGNIAVLNNFTLAGTSISSNFSLAGFNLTVGGNWLNSVNRTILNQGAIIFNGSASQSITRSTNEVFTNMIVNGTGTVALSRSINLTHLTINSGVFDVSASNFTVNLAGNFTNNGGIYNAQQGLFNINGTLAQSFSGSNSTNFYNITSANTAGVSVSSPITISNLLLVNSGSFGTNGSGEITLPATAATVYGRIASVGGSLTGTGWKIESYINGPATAYWQWLSSPINGNTLADWDNDPRFYMSGVGGNDGMAGSFKSVQNYNEPTDTYIDVTSVSTPLTAGLGFNIWMGDNLTQLTSSLVYNSLGTPNFGNISFPVTAGGSGSGYNLVGNPYACPITYSTVVAESGNLDASFIVLQENGSYATDPNGGIIAPNQGFMCVAYSSGSILFTEAAKNTSINPNILKSGTKSNVISINVYNNINGLGGETNIEFSENANDIFEQSKDLRFLASPYKEADNIWTNSSDHTALLTNVLYSNDDEKKVPLTVKSGVYGIHYISVKGLANLNLYNSVILEDLTSGKKTDLLKEQSYSFNADEIGKEYNFIIHFSKKEKSGSINEPLTITSLNENTSVYNTEGNVVVKFDMKEMTAVTISVYSLTGQQVIEPMKLNVTNDRITLPLQKDNSLYLLIIQSKDEQISRKIIR